MVSSKMCATCFETEHANKEAAPHVCPRNYSGSSKGMEADAALESYKELHRIGKILRQMKDYWNACIASNLKSMKLSTPPSQSMQEKVEHIVLQCP